QERRLGPGRRRAAAQRQLGLRRLAAERAKGARRHQHLPRLPFAVVRQGLRAPLRRALREPTVTPARPCAASRTAWPTACRYTPRRRARLSAAGTYTASRSVIPW